MARASRIVFCILFVFLLAVPVFAEETAPETSVIYSETMNPLFPSTPDYDVEIPSTVDMRFKFGGYSYLQTNCSTSYPIQFYHKASSQTSSVSEMASDIVFPFSPTRGKTYRLSYDVTLDFTSAPSGYYVTPYNCYPRLCDRDADDSYFGTYLSTVALKSSNSSAGIFCATNVYSQKISDYSYKVYVLAIVHFSETYSDTSFNLSLYPNLDLYSTFRLNKAYPSSMYATVVLNPVEIIDDPDGGEYTGELVELIGQLIDIQTGARSDAESFQTDALSALANIRNDLSGLTTGIDEGLAAAIEGANEQEKQELQNQYEDLVEQSNAGFTGLISSANLPAFVNVLTSFKNVLTYSGTQSLFTVPDLKIPSLYDSSGNVVVPATMLREGGVLNLTEMLSEWTEKIPWLNTLLTVFRAVVAISLIYFGFRCVMKIVNIDLKGLQHDLDSRAFWRW